MFLDNNEDLTNNSVAEEAENNNENSENSEELDLSYMDSNEDDDSDNEEVDDEESGEEHEVHTQKKSGRAQKRINNLVKRNSELEERLRKLEESYSSKANSKEHENKSTTESSKELVKPKESDFEDYSEYVEALTDYKVELRERKREEDNSRSRKESAEKEKIDKLVSGYQENIKKASEKYYPDFHEQLVNIKDVMFADAAAETLLGSEFGAHMSYYLSKNKDKAKEIASKSQSQQVREFLKIEEAFKRKFSGNKKEHNPLEPTRNSSRESKIVSSTIKENMSFEDFMKVRNKQQNKK